MGSHSNATPTKRCPKLWPVLFCAMGMISATAALAADKASDWKARMAELAKPQADEVVFTAAGDAIWNHKITAANDVGVRGLFDVTRGSDITFLNFEQVLADSGYPVIKEISKADPAMVEEFVQANVNLVSVANNHIMDFGPKGVATTLRVLDDHGIKHAGAGANLTEALRPAVIEKKGLKVALLAVLVSPQFPQIAMPATESSPGMAPIHGTKVRLLGGKSAFAPSDDDLHALEDAIKEARKSADFVAVSMHIHWGPLEEIDPEGKQLVARAAVDAGADIVLGHGPHVVNGIEFYKGKPIVYSMGNFAFQFDPDAYTFFPDSQKQVRTLMANERLYRGVMLRMMVSTQGKLRRMEVLPLGLDHEGSPHLASGAAADAVLDQVKTLSEPFGTAIKREGWYELVDLPQQQAVAP